MAVILLAAPSGAGKTTAVDALVASNPDLFAAIPAYTTRARRPEESCGSRFTFVSEDEFDALEADGALLHVDKAYGHRYALDRGAFMSALVAGQHVVQEAYPENFEHFRQYGVRVVTVVARGDGIAREVRAEDERVWVEASENADISVEFGVLRDAPRLASVVLGYLVMPTDAKRRVESERLNSQAYDKLASEFTDDRRVTTATFHAASRDFLSRHVHELKPGSRVLEIGPGTGWLRSDIEWPPDVDYVAAEISPAMAEACRASTGDPIVLASSSELPFGAGQFEAMFAVLCDPYIGPESLTEWKRVLKRHGLLVFTVPAERWSRALRPQHARHVTTFLNLVGEPVETTAVGLRPSQLVSLLEICGFDLLTLADVATPRPHPIPPAVESAARTLEVDARNLPVVTLVTARRSD